MNHQEAQFILRAYRSNGQDADDPQFQEALAHAKNDPALAQWLAEEMALDTAISAKIKQTLVPPDLKMNILAARKIIRLQPWWQTKSWLAAAASFLILLGGFGFWMTHKTNDEFAFYRHDMATFLTKLDRLDVSTSDMTKIKNWLSQRNAHGDFVVPAGLNDLSSLGCRVLDWRGQKVTLVCFKADGPKEVHMFIVDRGAFPSVPENKPHFAQDGVWATASWSHENKTYLLASMGDVSLLRKYL